MKLSILMALVVLISGAVRSGDQKRVANTEEVIREMDGKLTAALLQGNPASVDGIVADDYIEINAQGLVSHKSDLMAIVRARASAPSSKSLGPEISVGETTFRMHGNTAILVSLITTRYQFMEYQTVPQSSQMPAPNAATQERLMKVYSKLNKRWQLVASQTTALPQR